MACCMLAPRHRSTAQATRQGWPYERRPLHKRHEPPVQSRATHGGWPAVPGRIRSEACGTPWLTHLYAGPPPFRYRTIHRTSVRYLSFYNPFLSYTEGEPVKYTRTCHAERQQAVSPE